MPDVPTSARAACTIEEFRTWWISIPLNRPYYTANNPGGRRALEVLLIRASDTNGRQGWGEACPALSGYSPETPSSGWSFLSEFLPKMLGAPDDAKAALVDSLFHEYPFVLSAYRECLADLAGETLLRPDQNRLELELAGTVNTLDIDEAALIAAEYVDAGYSTLKVKVGIDPKRDAARVKRIYHAVDGRARLRVDANRAYAPAAALEFAHSVPVDAIEYFEQPFGHSKWRETEELAKTCPLPLMLDESIYGMEDIARAADTGCAQAVKLKMSKVGGPKALVAHMNFARECGLEVVVGNGVASDFGCYREALCCAKAGLSTAGEMNGFLKLSQALLSSGLAMRGPRLVLEAGSSPQIMEDQIESLAQKATWIH